MCHHVSSVRIPAERMCVEAVCGRIKRNDSVNIYNEPQLNQETQLMYLIIQMLISHIKIFTRPPAGAPGTGSAPGGLNGNYEYPSPYSTQLTATCLPRYQIGTATHVLARKALQRLTIIRLLYDFKQIAPATLVFQSQQNTAPVYFAFY